MIDVIKQELLTPYFDYGFYNTNNGDFIGYLDEDNDDLIVNIYKPEYRDLTLKDLNVVGIQASLF